MPQTVTLPTLAEGETYAGLILNADGSPAHHLILLPGDAEEADWATQQAWARSIGGELPTRAEQALLFANCKQHFQHYWYWSGEQLASDPSYAWRQYFGNGGQIYHYASYRLRARAVRRLVIQ
jgi:hypothetical protein